MALGAANLNVRHAISHSEWRDYDFTALTGDYLGGRHLILNSVPNSNLHSSSLLTALQRECHYPKN